MREINLFNIDSHFHVCTWLSECAGVTMIAPKAGGKLSKKKGSFCMGVCYCA